MPFLRPSVIGQTARLRGTVSVVVRYAIAQRACPYVGLSAVVRVCVLRFLPDVDDVDATRTQRLQHPDDIVGMGFDSASEIELSTAALRPGHDEQVREPVAVKAEESLNTLRPPLVS